MYTNRQLAFFFKYYKQNFDTLLCSKPNCFGLSRSCPLDMKTNNMPIMPTVKLTPDIGSVAKVHDRTTLFDNEMSGIHNDIFSPKNLQLSASQTNQPRIYPLITIYKITD